MQETIEIVCCYARKDQQFLIELKTHLSPLEKKGHIHLWDDTDISAGTTWESEVSHHLDQAKIILILISSDFMSSNYCYSKEMKRAIERHEHGEAHVIPIIVRHTLWKETPLAKLQVLPQNGMPITSWSDRDAAFLDIAKGIRHIAEEVARATATHQSVMEQKQPSLPPPIQEKVTDQVSKLIMVIDDTPTIRKIIELVLQREGFEVKSFPDGIEALRWLITPQGHIPNLIFIDIGLPKMNGYEVARYLRTKPEFQNTVIVMLSRLDGVIDRLKGRLAGAKDYITKPFNGQMLISVTHSHIGLPNLD